MYFEVHVVTSAYTLLHISAYAANFTLSYHLIFIPPCLCHLATTVVHAYTYLAHLLFVDTDTNTHKHIHTHTDTHKQESTHPEAHMHLETHTHTHLEIHTHPEAHARTHPETHTHPEKHTHIHPKAHTYRRPEIHTHPEAHTHIHIQKPTQRLPPYSSVVNLCYSSGLSSLGSFVTNISTPSVILSQLEGEFQY